MLEAGGCSPGAQAGTALRPHCRPKQHGRGGRVGQDFGPADGPGKAPGQLGAGPPGEPGLRAPGQQWFPVPASGALEVQLGGLLWGSGRRSEGAKLSRHQPVLGVALALREAGPGVCLPGLGTQQVGGRAGSSLSLLGSGGVGGAVCPLPARRRAESLPAGHLQASRRPGPGKAAGSRDGHRPVADFVHHSSSSFPWQHWQLEQGGSLPCPAEGLSARTKKEEAVLARAVAERGPRREPRGLWVPTRAVPSLMRTASVRQAATGQTGCGVFQGPAGRAPVGDGSVWTPWAAVL